MPRSVRWKGSNIRRPGAYTWHDLSGLANLELGTEKSIIIIGEAVAGEPQTTAQTPVYHEFTDPEDMIDTFLEGNLAEVARLAFKPARDGQEESGVPIGGCEKVYVIKVNPSTQASFTLQDGSSNNAVTLSDRLWGAKGNQTWFKLEVSGTGLKLTCGRDVEPNLGEYVHTKLFSITGTDEWVQFETAAGYTGASCAVTFDGTTLTFNSSVANEDLAITCTGKTMTEIISEVNAFMGVAPGANPIYLATNLRPNDRANTLSTYLDRIGGAGLDIHAGAKKALGVAYDIVEEVNANNPYVEATWVAGYEPTTYTKKWLVSGAAGDATTTTIQEALKTAKKLPSRFIASTFSADTGAAGAISVDTINGYFTTHLNQCNPIGGRSERQGILCTESALKADLYTELNAINNEWACAVNHEVYAQGEGTAKKWLGTHGAAVQVAAMMAGSPVATPMTFKILNCNDMRYVAADFDPADDTDFANGIDYGLMMAEVSDGLFRIAKGISTYKTEDNDLRILTEGVEARLWTAIALRRKFESPNIGHKGKGLPTAEDLRGQAIEVFRALADQTSPDFVLVEGTNSDGEIVAPFSNVRVSLVGDQIYLRADLMYTLGVNFIFNEFRATYPYALAA